MPGSGARDGTDPKIAADVPGTDFNGLAYAFAGAHPHAVERVNGVERYPRCQ